MPDFSLRHVCWIGMASLLLLLGATTWATESDVRQQQKDVLLIDAIKLNKINNVFRLLAEGASPNVQYTPMTMQEVELAENERTWPLPPKHRNLGQSQSDRTSSNRSNKPTNHEKPISALNVALDIYLDCPFDGRLPPCHSALIKALIEAGADVNARGRYDRTPLLMAMNDNRRDIVPLLLARHADVFARDAYGNTSLMAAAGMGNVDLVRSLLRQGLDVNAKNKHGMTPLMFACYTHSHAGPDMIQILLEHGANVNAKLDDGKTTLMLAKWYANSKIVSLLKKADAK